MRSIFLNLSAAAITLAADFWQQKPPDKWSPQECKKLLSKSPWAMDAPVTGNPPSSESTGRVGFNPSGSSGADGTAMRTVSVRWESAEPVQAAAKRVNAPELSASDAAQFYVIHVSNLQIPGANESVIAAELQRTFDRLRSQAKLTRKGKPPIACAKVTGKLIGGPGLLFFFPRKDAEINEGDKEVQFETELTTLDLKAKFPLKNMTFGTGLSL
jgi:hypothetical protein